MAPVWRPLETATTLARDALGVASAFREAFRADASTARPGSLLGEQARPSAASMNSPFRASIGSNLKPERLAAILSAAVNGDADAYLTLAEEMEERELHYRSVLGTRKLAVAGLEVNVESASDSAHDIAIADDLQELMRRPEVKGLKVDMMDAIAKGFSNVEIIWKRDVNRWEPEAYKHRSPRHFLWDQDTLEVCTLRTLTSTFEGDPLRPFKWIQHRPKLTSGVPLRSGLALPVALAYMAKKYTIADWLVFLDVYGMPMRVGKYPASMEKRKNELLRAVMQLGTDAAAVVPMDMTVELIQATQGGGANHFLTSAEYWDKQTSKGVLGQTMSSDDGASLSQAKVHERVRFDIKADDADSIAATLNRDVAIPFIQLNYGPQKKYPRIWFKVSEPENVLLRMQATEIFVNQGGGVQMSEARDLIGWSEPDKGAQLLQPTAKVTADAQPPEPKPADPAKPNDAPPADDKKAAEKSLNRQVRQLVELLSSKPRADDVIDELVDEDLSEWEPLLDENVGEMLRLVQGAATFEEAGDLLRKLAEDKGVTLDFGSFQDALARSTFKTRGIGSATDET